MNLLLVGKRVENNVAYKIWFTYGLFNHAWQRVAVEFFSARQDHIGNTIIQRFSRAGPRGRAREWATQGVHPLSWLLSNNRLEEVCGTLTKGTFSSRLLLSNQDKGCTPSVAHSLPLPPGFCSTCQVIMEGRGGNRQIVGIKLCYLVKRQSADEFTHSKRFLGSKSEKEKKNNNNNNTKAKESLRLLKSTLKHGTRWIFVLASVASRTLADQCPGTNKCNKVVSAFRSLVPENPGSLKSRPHERSLGMLSRILSPDEEARRSLFLLWRG